MKFFKSNGEFKIILKNFELKEEERGKKLVKMLRPSALLPSTCIFHRQLPAEYDCCNPTERIGQLLPAIAVQQGIMQCSFRFDWLTRPGQSARTSKNKYEYDRQMLEHGNALKWQSIALWPISAHMKDTWPSRSSAFPRTPPRKCTVRVNLSLSSVLRLTWMRSTGARRRSDREWEREWETKNMMCNTRKYLLYFRIFVYIVCTYVLFALYVSVCAAVASPCKV